MKDALASFFAGRVLSRAVAGATLVGLATAVPGVYAQETSATVRGAVSTSSGEALAVPSRALAMRLSGRFVSDLTIGSNP